MIRLPHAKQHIRVDHNDDDPYIGKCIAAASEWLVAIGVDKNIDPVPAPIKHAALLMVGHFYENREAVPDFRAATVLPLGVEALVAPYRAHSI